MLIQGMTPQAVWTVCRDAKYIHDKGRFTNLQQQKKNRSYPEVSDHSCMSDCYVSFFSLSALHHLQGNRLKDMKVISEYEEKN